MVASLTFPHLALLTFSLDLSLLLCSDDRRNIRPRVLVSTLFCGLIIFMVWQQLLGTGTPQDVTSVSSQSFLFSDPKSIMDAEVISLLLWKAEPDLTELQMLHFQLPDLSTPNQLATYCKILLAIIY